MSRYWAEVRELYSPFESGPRSPSADLYELEMPGGPVHQLVPASQGAGAGFALARGVQGVFAGQPALRQHHQGDAELEGGRGHGALRGCQQPDFRRRARSGAGAGVSGERGGVFRGPAGPAAGRVSEGASGQGAERAPSRSRIGLVPGWPRPTFRWRGRRRRRCWAGKQATAMRSAICFIRGCFPIWPRTSARIPIRRSCRRRSSSSARTWGSSTRSRSSRGRR